MGLSASDCLTATVLTARAPLVAVVLCPGEALRRHGGKPRKAGERYPGGQLVYERDRELEPLDMTLAKRAAIVGKAHEHDPRASHTLGQALLNHLLEDAWDEFTSAEKREQLAQRRYDAILDFAGLHHRVFGLNSAKSILKNAAAGALSSVSPSGSGDNLADAVRLGRQIKLVRLIVPPRDGMPLAYHVLQEVAVFEGPIDTAGQPDVRLLDDDQLWCLRAAGDALLSDRARGRAKPLTKLPRARGLDVVFNRAGDGPDNEALLNAVARLKSHSARSGP